MEGIINYLWEGSICFFLLFGFYRIFLSSHTFFDWNRIFLLVSMVLVLVIPLLNLPAFYSPEASLLAANYTYYLPEFELNNATVHNQIFSLSSLMVLLIGVYSVGVIIAFTKFIVGLVQIFHHIQISEKVVHQGKIIAVNPEFQPSSFFHYIFMPEYNPADSDHRLILSHESVHASRYHSIDMLLLQVINIVFWFHPFKQMLASNLSEVHEYQVDDEITKFCAKTEYANLLLNLIMADREKQLMNNHFNKFQTKKRIIMMGKAKSKEMEKSRFLLAIPLLALLVTVFSCGEQEDHELLLEEDTSGELILKASSGGEIFDVVENPPVPPGGFEGWNNYLGNNLTYPSRAKKDGIEGTVYVAFVVEVDGSIQGVEIIRGIGGGCDEEAMRVIRNSPDWEPGMQQGQKVNVKIRVPIKFKLPANTI